MGEEVYSTAAVRKHVRISLLRGVDDMVFLFQYHYFYLLVLRNFSRVAGMNTAGMLV